MSDHWKCPNCKAFFEKTPPMKAGERWHQQYVLQHEYGSLFQEMILANPKTSPCPACKQAVDTWALFSGKYDYAPHFLPKPATAQLDKELQDILKVLLGEAAIRARKSGKTLSAFTRDIDDVTTEAIRSTGQLLFEKYGLSETEFQEAIHRSYGKAPKPGE